MPQFSPDNCVHSEYGHLVHGFSVSRDEFENRFREIGEVFADSVELGRKFRSNLFGYHMGCFSSGQLVQLHKSRSNRLKFPFLVHGVVEVSDDDFVVFEPPLSSMKFRALKLSSLPTLVEFERDGVVSEDGKLLESLLKDQLKVGDMEHVNGGGIYTVVPDTVIGEVFDCGEKMLPVLV